jgi:exodeoxyribonuclease V alpha subunit
MGFREDLKKLGLDKLVKPLNAWQLNDLCKDPFEAKCAQKWPWDTRLRIAKDALNWSDARCDAARAYERLCEAEANGHTCVKIDAISEDSLASLRAQDKVHVYRGHVYTKAMWLAESVVAKRIGEFLRQTRDKACDVDAGALASLTDEQSRAVRMAFAHPLSIVTGSAGCGKTTVLRAISCAAGAAGVQVAFAAPTGAAAKRIREQTQGHLTAVPCTVHRLLEAHVDGSGRFVFKRNSRNLLPCGLLVVDEASMLDTWLASKLLNALDPARTSLVLLGDHHQLPSVGAGRVLGDLLSCSAIPKTCLTKIMRQAQGSRLVQVAHGIVEGRFDVEFGGKYGDFEWIDTSDAADIFQEVHTRCAAERHQVLCPRRTPTADGLYTGRLNEMLQKTYNKGVRTLPYAVGDCVMNVKNDAERNLLNGDKGSVVLVSGDSVTVQYEDGELRVHKTNDPALTLAFAITCHKAQGDEFDRVIVVLHPSHGQLLQREMLYTALTRGKQHVLLMGSRACVAACLQNTAADKRCTLLAARIGAHL